MRQLREAGYYAALATTQGHRYVYVMVPIEATTGEIIDHKAMYDLKYLKKTNGSYFGKEIKLYNSGQGWDGVIE